jgi:agmatine deiminase
MGFLRSILSLIGDLMDDYLHSPVGEGFFMPGEWEPHARCWVQWPSRTERWRDLMPQAYAEAAEVIRAIAAFEPVSVIVREEDAAQARFACGRHDGIRFFEAPIDDCWARDTAPTFVTNGVDAIAGIAWQFNGWGNSIHHYKHDATLADRILQREKIRNFKGDMVLEGGAISADGYGTVIVTEECLLNEDRNPELTQPEIEERLALFLGVRKVLWLGGGLAADSTQGQVSRVAVFAGRDRVLVSEISDPDDLDRATLEDNRAHLENAVTARGDKLTVTSVPLPKNQLIDLDGNRLAANYLDYYVANDAVIVPSYDDPNDTVAAFIIGAVYPGRKVVQVPTPVLAQGGGAIRRLTQPEPSLPGGES